MLRLLLEFVFLFLVGCLMVIGMVLFVAMPEVLEWMSRWIGDIMSWILYIFLVVSIIVISINKTR